MYFSCFQPDVQEIDMENEEQIQRLSSRIKSMTRRGMINLDRFKSIKFLYVANDYLAVRGSGNDFYLCRVLEDVLENSDPFNIAWLDRVDASKQQYKVMWSITIITVSKFKFTCKIVWIRVTNFTFLVKKVLCSLE